MKNKIILEAETQFIDEECRKELEKLSNKFTKLREEIIYLKMRFNDNLNK